MEQLLEEEVNRIIGFALAEDTLYGDVTSEALIPAGLTGTAAMLVKEKGVLAGIEIAGRTFRGVDPALVFKSLISDGLPVSPGDTAATVSGNVASILKAERTALNFLQRLSGIASLTARYVTAAGGRIRIADTRKTTPGLRLLEKYAVRMGGGSNHRFHLGDGILIKDNHLAALRALGMSLSEIVSRAREKAPAGIRVEVEVTSAAEAGEAVRAGADIIMLDNMGPEEMREAVSLFSGKVEIEASGGVNLDNIERIAETGVDFISIGALTHSYKSLDISLELLPESLKLA